MGWRSRPPFVAPYPSQITLPSEGSTQPHQIASPTGRPDDGPGPCGPVNRPSAANLSRALAGPRGSERTHVTKRFIHAKPLPRPNRTRPLPNLCPVEAGPLHCASAINVDSSAAYGLDSRLCFPPVNFYACATDLNRPPNQRLEFLPHS